MKVKPTIAQQEFIGLEASVTKSPNLHSMHITGVVVDETRKTFVIQQDRKRKTVMKNQTLFHFTLPDKTTVKIDGKILLGRPEERLKKRIRRLW
ncbi:MAG: ribonuclease P protein subunit [Candidatus Bathyarchaeota archaeon]|nr:ribonuclease P protein subunit [Candidatus Bathyarchaeota archaeon]